MSPMGDVAQLDFAEEPDVLECSMKRFNDGSDCDLLAADKMEPVDDDAETWPSQTASAAAQQDWHAPAPSFNSADVRILWNCLG